VQDELPHFLYGPENGGAAQYPISDQAQQWVVCSWDFKTLK